MAKWIFQGLTDVGLSRDKKKWKRMINMNKKMCFIENLIFSIFEIENIHFRHKINENHGKS